MGKNNEVWNEGTGNWSETTFATKYKAFSHYGDNWGWQFTNEAKTGFTEEAPKVILETPWMMNAFSIKPEPTKEEIKAIIDEFITSVVESLVDGIEAYEQEALEDIDDV